MSENKNSFFNLGGSFTPSVAESYDTKSRKLVKLADAQPQRLYGFIVSKEGTWGRSILLCGETNLIVLPKRYVDTFTAYTDEQKAELCSGRYFIDNIREFKTQNGKTFLFDIVTK